MTPIQFQQEYKSNYINVIKNIKLKINSNDTILLCTLHPVTEVFATYSYYLNNIIREIGKELQLDIFDEERIVRESSIDTPKRSEYLNRDGIHHSTQLNDKYVKMLMKYVIERNNNYTRVQLHNNNNSNNNSNNNNSLSSPTVIPTIPPNKEISWIN